MYVRFKKFRIAKSSTKKLICDSAISSNSSGPRREDGMTKLVGFFDRKTLDLSPRLHDGVHSWF
jgi:hypothetical protein